MSGTYRNKSSNASWCSSSPAPWGSTRSWWGFRAPPSVCCRWWTRCTNYSHPARTSALAFRIFYRWFCRRWSSRVESGSTMASRCVAFRFRRWLCDGRKEEREREKKTEKSDAEMLWSVCFLLSFLFVISNTSQEIQWCLPPEPDEWRWEREKNNTLTSSGRSSNYLDRFSVFSHLGGLTGHGSGDPLSTLVWLGLIQL